MKKTQRNISKRFDIDETLLSKILHGKRNITYERAKSLNAMTRIDVDFWMTAKPEDLKEVFKRLVA